MNITKSSDIVVDKTWQVVQPFSIYIKELTDTPDSWNTNIKWNDDRGGKGNFPDFKNYMITIYERKWALIYNDGRTVWNVFFGLQDGTFLNNKGIYYGFDSSIDECGTWKTDMTGYRIGDLIDGKRILKCQLALQP